MMVVMNESSSHGQMSCTDQSVKGGVSFIQALHEKYVDQVEFNHQFSLPKDSYISTEITFVGFDEITNVQRQLRRLASIDLSGRNITKAGDVHLIGGSLDRVTVLNLADNHLSWQEVIHILRCLPHLREIILSANDLERGGDVSYPEEPFQGLQSIVLGRINLNWQTIVERLSKIWTRIGQIDLWDNQLVDDSMRLSDSFQSDPFVKHAKSLVLSQNRFSNLAWVCRMGELDNLVELDVSRCKLETLDINNRVVEHLKSLKILNISYNDLSSWQEVAQLQHFPNMISLICYENPFYLTDKFARSQTIARIGSLVSLNRETITSAARRDSEIFYLKRYFSEYEAFINERNGNFRLAHPRYEELTRVYGVLGDIGAKQSHVEDKYVTVELCHDDAKVMKKVPRDMRVSNLKMLCKAMFKLRLPRGIEIVCCDSKSPQKSLCYPLDQDGQTLHFFSVENGHQLIVKSSD